MIHNLLDRCLIKYKPLSILGFKVMLWGMALAMKARRLYDRKFQARLFEKDFTAQIKAKDGSVARWFSFKNGAVRSGRGIHPHAAMSLVLSGRGLGGQPDPGLWATSLAQINAMKNFKVDIQGPDEYTLWFTQTLNLLKKLRIPAQIRHSPAGRAWCATPTTPTAGRSSCTSITARSSASPPLNLMKQDPEPWTIKARGREFTPPRKGTVNPYVFALKSLIYSPDRLLHPMKRVDFDPNGERNCASRGVSGYERISWMRPWIWWPPRSSG